MSKPAAQILREMRTAADGFQDERKTKRERRRQEDRRIKGLKKQGNGLYRFICWDCDVELRDVGRAVAIAYAREHWQQPHALPPRRGKLSRNGPSRNGTAVVYVTFDEFQQMGL